MRVNLRVVLPALLLCGLALSGTALAQTVGTGPHAAQIPAGAFFQTSPSTQWGDKFYMYPNSTEAVELRAPVNVPSGARIYQIGIWCYDASDTGDVSVELWSIPVDTTQDPELIGTATSTGATGYQFASVAQGAIAYTVRNDLQTGGANAYVVVHLPANAQTQAGFKSVDIRYDTTVSQPVFSPTFGDVPADHPFYVFVEALAASEITAGCGNGNFCPDLPVTRGQMAVFLAKGLGLFWP